MNDRPTATADAGLVEASSRWQPGDVIVLRGVWWGRIWDARPLVVVHDLPNEIALFMPVGAQWMKATSADRSALRFPTSSGMDWELAAISPRWKANILRLSTPGSDHSVLLIWDEDFHEMRLWYVNLEAPLRRTSVGFDYQDQILDVEVSPDRSTCRWKDEDELQEAVDLGVVSAQRAAELRAEGESVIERMEANEPPFNQGWEHWRPNPAWPVPELPAGWDVIE